MTQEADWESKSQKWRTEDIWDFHMIDFDVILWDFDIVSVNVNISKIVRKRVINIF